MKSLNKLHGLEFLVIEVIKESPDYKKPEFVKPQNEVRKFVIPIGFSLDQLKNKDWSEYHMIKGKQFVESGDFDSAIINLKKSIFL